MFEKSQAESWESKTVVSRQWRVRVIERVRRVKGLGFWEKGWVWRGRSVLWGSGYSGRVMLGFGELEGVRKVRKAL